MESLTNEAANQVKNQKILKKAQANPPQRSLGNLENIDGGKEWHVKSQQQRAVEAFAERENNMLHSKGKTVYDIDKASAKRAEKLIKTAEDIAEMKEMEIEREFVEEMQQQIMKMHMVMQKFKEVDIEKLNEEEYDKKQIEAKKRTVENREAKKMGIEMDTKQMERKEVDKEIMKKMKKMIESEYREMMVLEVREKIMEAEDFIKKVKEPKNMETIKEAEIIKKIKNMIEAGFLQRMAEDGNGGRDGLNITMAKASTSRTKHSTIDTVRREAWKLFNGSIERCDFSNIKSEALISSCTKKGWSDFACYNVLRIWPKLRKIGTKLQGPKDVGKEIIRNLPQSDMIEGTPSLHSVGFVTFKISGKWMAKRILRMLIEGIKTWAPETLLERAIVDFPSLDIGEDMDMDMLRRRYIGRSLTRMLQYCQVHVLNNPHEGDHVSYARNVVKTRVIGGAMEVCYNDGKERKLLVSNCGQSVQGLGNASKDLGALRYGVEQLKAQWLLYVTPVAKQKYIEMCFTAAKAAKWLEPACATYVGYRSCTSKLSKLVYMLNEGKALHKVTAFVLRGNAANYSARDVLECAIQYMLLKTPSMADCTFNIDEILDEKADTLLYLLNTQARIRSVTNTSRKDIRELKNASRLILEKDDLLERGEERELGFHILDLTEVLRSCCFAALPHILCKYLHNLAEIFNRYFVSTFALGWRTECFLLLCEATSVVMEKCFHLLEITPQCFKNKLGVTRLIYGAELSVERPINVGSNPPKSQNTRFEPFSIQLRVDRKFESDSELGVIKVFGHVDVADTYGLRSDGWTLTYLPDDLNVELFRRSWSDPINILNGGCLSFGDPSCSRSVPFSSVMEIEMYIVAMKEEEDDFYTICSCRYDLDFSKFLDGELDGWCDSSTVKGKDGQARINYILLRDAVDATIEITFNTRLENLKVHGDIVAWYESIFPFDCNPIEKSFYTASLFELDGSSILKSGPIKLQKSRIAVPRKGSLKIKAHLIEVNSGSMILDTSCVFQSLTDASSKECLEGTDCYFQVKVNWSYCQE